MLFSSIVSLADEKQAPDLWFLAAQLAGEDLPKERAKVRDQLDRMFREKSERGSEKELEEHARWFRALPAREREELSSKLVPSLLKWRLRHRLEAFLEQPVPEEDRPRKREWGPGSGAKDGASEPPPESELPDEMGEIFLRFLKAGLADETAGDQELLQMSAGPYNSRRFADRHGFLLSQGMLGCHRSLDEKNYAKLVGLMESIWTYSGPETDGAAIGTDWSPTMLHLYWDVARHVGFDPETYLSSAYSNHLPPGSAACGGEKTLLKVLGKKGVPPVYDRLDKLEQMLLRIPGHGPAAEKAAGERKEKIRPLKVSDELVKRSYDVVADLLGSSDSHYSVNRCLTILSRHPDKAYAEQMRPHLQSAHPKISALASQLLGEPARKYPDDYSRPQLLLRHKGGPVVQEKFLIRQGTAGSGSASSTSRDSDDSGALSFGRRESSYLLPEKCIITLAPGTYEGKTYEETPKVIWGANFPMTELPEDGIIDFKTAPVALEMSVPKNRQGLLEAGEIEAQLTLFAEQENHGLGSSPRTYLIFPLELGEKNSAFPDLPLGKHRLKLTCPGCLPIQVTVEVAAKEDANHLKAGFESCHTLPVKLLDEEGAELTLRRTRYFRLTDEDGKVEVRYLSKSGSITNLRPGRYEIHLTTRDAAEILQKRELTIREDDPPILEKGLEFRIPTE